MSHVDDGELTAYADGAYPVDSPETQRIAAHLALCANCRNRLDEERALTGRAAEILAVAAPSEITTPDFAQVSAAAAAVRRRRNAVPLTWAATVILALGIGWFGRGALYQPVQQSVLTSSENTRAPADMTAAAPENAEPVPQLREQTATGAAARRSTPSMPIERQDAQAANAIDEATRVEPTAAPAPSAAIAPLDRDLAQSQQGARAAKQKDALAVTGRVAGDFDYMTAAEAERRSVTLHAIPELEILRVGMKESEVVVEQKLPDGKVLTITSTELARTEGFADAAAKRVTAPAAAPPIIAETRARNDAAMQKLAAPAIEAMRGNLRLRVSAALPADSLRALLAKVR